MMTLKKLPIGIQSFSTIITDGYAYVDKTKYISKLALQGKYYFLSRPRRFGKSLLIDTIDCAFSGKRVLFSGLYLDTPESGWDFSFQYPVLRIDWSVAPVRTPEELERRIHEILDTWALHYECTPVPSTSGGKLDFIVRNIQQKTGMQVVILIDEYDKPILDTLKSPVIAAEMRDMLRDFYGVLKSLDSSLKFVMLTGVSKFVKTGIFSGLNNLNDITLDRTYSAICGYTECDLDLVFKEYIHEYDQEKVREWYNGYSWTGERVYNPFDILLLFSKGIFRPYWFETGTPGFLIELWKNAPRLPAEFDGMVVGDEILGSFDPEQIRVETLLFQAGYLTIHSWESNPDIGTWYTLGFPNREVRESFNRMILSILGPDTPNISVPAYRTILESGDTEGLRTRIHALFSSIPHDWYRKNPISQYEGYYASVFYAWLSSLGFTVIPEDVTNKGRIDLSVQTGLITWIFEFKVLGIDRSGERNPLDQIKNQGYAEKYLAKSKQVILIGIVWNPKTRNLEQWEVSAG